MATVSYINHCISHNFLIFKAAILTLPNIAICFILLIKIRIYKLVNLGTFLNLIYEKVR